MEPTLAEINKWWRSLSINEMKSLEKKYNTIYGMALTREIAHIYKTELNQKEEHGTETRVAYAS